MYLSHSLTKALFVENGTLLARKADSPLGRKAKGASLGRRLFI
jgi:hypothetical protein